jgi:hypothetical protein
MVSYYNPQETPAQREAAIRAAGYTGEFGKGGADAFLMKQFGTTATPTVNAADNVMPVTVEPLHQFERAALTKLGTATPESIRAGGIDPRTGQFLDRFGQMTDEAAGMIRGGTQGFDQAEFDSVYNPYTKDVTNRSVERLSEQAQNMRANLLRTTASNRGNASFGDLYGAQRMGDIDKELLSKSGDVIAQGNQQGFATALQALEERRKRQLQGGQTMAGAGGNFINAASTAQNIANSGFEQGMNTTNAQVGAGGYIRNYNQGVSNLAFQNFNQPQMDANALTDASVSGYNGVRGAQQGYTQPYVADNYDRFGTIAQGVGQTLQDINKIKF